MPPIAENHRRRTSTGPTTHHLHQPLVASEAPQEASASPGSDPSQALLQPGSSRAAFFASGKAPSTTKKDLQGSSPPSSSSSPEEDDGGKGSSTQRNMDRYSHDPAAARECFKLEPCLHTQRMLKQAAVILEKMSEERPLLGLGDRRQSAPAGAFGPGKGEGGAQGSGDASSSTSTSSSDCVPSLVFEGPEEKKRTFELALSALNYQMVFEDILEDCEFFKLYPKLQEDRNLVMVVLWDYQSRKFQARRWGEEEEEEQAARGAPGGSGSGSGSGWEEIQLIETALMEQQTKLKACLARRRIKASAPRIEFLLPDHVRRRSSSQRPMAICAWVNALKTSVMEVVEELKAGGLTLLPGPPPNGEGFREGSSFYMDPNCLDLLVFSPDCAGQLHQHPLVRQAHLVCQDKSSCLAAHSVVPLSGGSGDVLVVNPGPVGLVGHLAVLLRYHTGAIVVVSPQRDDQDDDDQQRSKMTTHLDSLGVTKEVKVIREEFTQLKADDVRLKNVTTALVIADCSKSAVSNLVQYVVTEGENMKLLGKLSDPEDAETHMSELQENHVAHLRHALNMSKLRSVAYLTRSVHPAENEAVIDKSTEFVNTTIQQQQQQQQHKRDNSISLQNKLLPWMVTAPVLPFSAHDLEQGQKGAVVDDRYVRFLPSELTSGCFLVCVVRRPEDAASVLARAKSKGLLGGKPSKDSGDCGQRRGSCSKRNKALRRLSSPVRPVACKVTDYKIPDYQKVVYHPTPFK